MRFVWDEEKRNSNVAKHGLDFADAEKVFSGATLGLVNDVVVVVAHTETDEEIRVISMRKATKNEEENYFQSFAN